MREQIANHTIPRRATATQSYVPANPHKAGHYSGFHPEDQPYQSTDIEEDDRFYQQRSPTSVRRYQTPDGNQVIEKDNKRIVIHEVSPPKKKRQVHWLVYLGAGMLLMLSIGYGIWQFSIWWNNHQMDSQYGFPRTWQTDERVGFGDSLIPTHFIAINLNGQTEVIVCPASNCTKAVVYLGPRLFGDGSASVPVTISFQDISHNGRLDMIMLVGDQKIIFLNFGTQFKLQQ